MNLVGRESPCLYLGLDEEFPFRLQAIITSNHGEKIKKLQLRFIDCYKDKKLLQKEAESLMMCCDHFEEEIVAVVTGGKLAIISELVRESYTISAVIKAYLLLLEVETMNEETLINIIRTLDLAMLLGVPIAGWNIVNVISRIHSESHYQEDIRRFDAVGVHDDTVEPDTNVLTEVQPSLEVFISNYYEPCNAVKLPAINSDQWRALTGWQSPGYLKQLAGYRIVLVEMGDYSRGGRTRITTLGTYLDELMAGGTAEEIGYMAQHELLDQEPRLADDLQVPLYCSASDIEEPLINCWLGPKGTFSPLHYDPQPNFLAQIVGRKRVFLYPPDCSRFLYPRTDRFFNTSKVDLLNPDIERFPLFAHAQGSSCILRPGDMLFIPAGWWHAVQSLDISISVSATMMRNPSTLLPLATLMLNYFRPFTFTFSRKKSTLACQEMFKTIEKGSLFTENFRLFFENENGPISPLHDIPLLADPEKKIYNMVVEIPRWTNAKMEISLAETLNPIKQDVKKGNVRFVANCFPHKGYIWNYGALPQTWENPLHLDDSTGCKGDNDPIDVLEIGSRVANRGDVVPVKILGVLALIDEGETDWKVLTIDSRDPVADKINDVNDIETHFPGLLKATVEWFKIYKIPDGKPENQFAFNGESKNREFALRIVEETHNFWKSLIGGEVDGGSISLGNVTVEGSSSQISSAQAQQALSSAAEVGTPATLDSTVIDKWHYITLSKN